MANKRQELKELVKGKGLDALKATAPPKEKVEKIESKDLKVLTEDTRKTLVSIEAKPVMIEIEPSPDEREIIQKLSGGAEVYALVWRAFTTIGEKENSVSSKGEIITFNIDCSVGKVLAQFKANYSLEMISFDVQSQHSQALYSYKTEDKIPFENFCVQFQALAALSGVFKIQTMLLIENTEHFHVYEGGYFRIK